MNAPNGHTDLFVRPADVLLFRDGRPFSAGDDHRATGLFPPPPVPFYGAFRAAAFVHQGVRFRKGGLDGVSQAVADEMGSSAEFGRMRMTRFSLAYAGSAGLVPLFPMPADVLRLKKGSEAPGAADWLRVTPTGFTGPVQPRTNRPLPGLRLLWKQRDERAWYEDRPAFVTQAHLACYLVRGLPPAPFQHPDAAASDGEGDEPFRAAFTTEPRTSIEVDNETQTADDGKLHTVDFTRANRDVGFAVRLAHAATLVEGRESGLLRLGGEARAAMFERSPIPGIGPAVVAEIRERIDRTKRCTLVLTTPAPFANGWIPDGIDPETGVGMLGACQDCRVKLAGAALGRAQHLGGWDIVKNRPRPTRRAVPAGSVYFFEPLEGDVRSLFEGEKALFGKSVCAKPDDRKLGLGIAYLGTW